MKKLIYILSLFTLMVSACKKNSTTDEVAPETIKPVVTSIQPKNPKPGDVVTITGTGFGTAATDVKVNIGTKAITITSVTATEIKFTLPAGLTEAAITVAIKDMAATITDPQGATIKPQPATQPVPTFTALSPATGKAGDIVTLTGTNFSTVLTENVVKFTGALSGAPVTAVVKTATATTITAEVPTGAITGGMSIEVKNVYAVLPTGFTGLFTIISSGVGSAGGTLALIEGLSTNAYAMATDDDGNVYLTSTNSAKNLLKISPAGQILKTYVAADFTTAGHIAGLCNDKNGVIWLIQGNSRGTAKLYKIAKGSDQITFVRNINADLVGYNQYSSLSTPLQDMAVDSKGNVFYVDNQYDIYKIDLAGAQTQYFDAEDLATDKSRDVRISDISIDKNDNMYAGGGNTGLNLSTLFKITDAKVVTQLFYSLSNGYADGAIAQARFERIYNLEVNADGTELYIGDVNYLRKVNLSTLQVTTAAGTGKAPSIIVVNGQFKINSEGPALEATSAPARISLCESKKILFIKHLNDSILQTYKY